MHYPILPNVESDAAGDDTIKSVTVTAKFQAAAANDTANATSTTVLPQ